MNSTTDFVITPAAIVSLPIAGLRQRFPVNRIFCVGRNYADHAREMGHDPNREPPFFFMKPPSALLDDNQNLPYPKQTSDLHHEVELVVALGQGGSNIPVEQAAAHIYGYGVGLDMTCRDIQNQAKKLSRTWETSKAFDDSAPCSALHPATVVGHPTKGRIELKVNGEVRQEGDLSQMIWDVPETIAYLSTLFELQAGDLIFTGTPAGVGPVQSGDRLQAVVENVAELAINVE
jgi:fumarylpyruvate hydrolase